MHSCPQSQHLAYAGTGQRRFVAMEIIVGKRITRGLLFLPTSTAASAAATSNSSIWIGDKMVAVVRGGGRTLKMTNTKMQNMKSQDIILLAQKGAHISGWIDWVDLALHFTLSDIYFMVDIRHPISSIESGVLYPPIMSLHCDHWSVTSVSRWPPGSRPP